MPTRPTAAKSLRQNVKRRAANRKAISGLRTQLKKFVKAVETGNVEAAREELRRSIKALDQKAARGLMHKRTAARRKSRLTLRLNKLVATGGTKTPKTTE